MTDRHGGYKIVLADDIREDDAEALITALRMIKGVVKVIPIKADYAHSLARARRDSEWADRLYALLKEMQS